MTGKRPVVVAAFEAKDDVLAIIEAGLGDISTLRFIHGASPEARRAALAESAAVLTWRPHMEYEAGELAAQTHLGLIQSVTAGIDFVPFEALPRGVPFATNAGAYAKPMAEHVMAMTLAAAKALFDRHEKLKRGVFEQWVPTRTLDGATCGILGFGGIGREVARLMRPFGASIMALNRSGKTDEDVAFAGTLADLDRVLEAADVLVLTLSLNKETKGLLGAREFGLMKKDAILVNVARGALIDQGALYRHLSDNPGFTACIEAWWVEPFVHGEFRLDYPLLDLPNVIGAPHNSAVVPGGIDHALRQATLHVRRFLEGETPVNVVTERDRVA
ncbi:MAG: 2-hydroxyacid dehydrogenase [Alphaproteobacteria bacterium]